MDNMREKFMQWAFVNNPDFKSDCHEEIAQRFDGGAEVTTLLHSFGGDFYSDITRITFSDGSELHLNYKGEVEG